MKKIAFAISAVIIIALSCQDDLSVDYQNENDPKSGKYIPNKPSNLIITGVWEEGISLAWEDSSFGEEGFIIERKDPGSYYFEVIDTIGKDVKEFIDEIHPIPDENYFYRLISIGKNKNSKYSDAAKAKLTLMPPENLTIESISETGFRLRWEDINYSKEGFEIFRLIDDGKSSKKIAELSADDYEYIFEGIDREDIFELYVTTKFSLHGPKLSDTLKVLYGVELNYLDKPKEDFKFDVWKWDNENLEFSSQNDYLLIRGNDPSFAKIWNFGGGGEITNFDRFAGFAAFHPDGEKLALTRFSGNDQAQSKICFYDIGSKSYSDSLDIPALYFNFNNAGNRLITLTEEEVILYDLSNKSVVWRKNNDNYSRVKFNGAGNKIVGLQDMPDDNDKITVLEANSGETINEFDPPGYNVEDFSISGDLIILAASSAAYFKYGIEPEIRDINNFERIFKTNISGTKTDFSGNGKLIGLTYVSDLDIYRTSDYKLIGRVDNSEVSFQSNYFEINYDASLAAIVGYPTTFIKLYSIENLWRKAVGPRKTYY